jgi:hypothetical protein
MTYLRFNRRGNSNVFKIGPKKSYYLLREGKKDINKLDIINSLTLDRVVQMMMSLTMTHKIKITSVITI